MKLIKTTEAEGHIICHDMTQIIPNVTKDARFRKGHIVTKEDIPVLLSMGKENLYVYEKMEGSLHEDEAAECLASLCFGKNMRKTKPKEGKIELISEIDGLLQVNVEGLYRVNVQEDIMIATRHTNTAVKKGDTIAGTRVIPLVIEKQKLDLAKEQAGKDVPLLRVLPFQYKTAAMVVTGSEVFIGRIEDKFGKVVKEKLEAFGVEMLETTYSDDSIEMITEKIEKMRATGADIIVCSGGMSVDPDDRTPAAIKKSGANIVSYGAPVLPGAMFLLGYFEDGTPIMGLPGCVMYAAATIFDIMLPKILAGVPVTKKDMAKLGHGGLCLKCKVCHYPNCSFGK